MLQTLIQSKKEKAKKHLEYLIEQNTPCKTASSGWLIDLKNSSRAKSHLLSSSQFKQKNKSARNRHYDYIIDLENLISQAKYISSSPNTKKQTKKNVKTYHYFIVEKNINNKDYKIILNTEEYITEQNSIPKIVHLYDITEYKK